MFGWGFSTEKFLQNFLAFAIIVGFIVWIYLAHKKQGFKETLAQVKEMIKGEK